MSRLEMAEQAGCSVHSVRSAIETGLLPAKALSEDDIPLCYAWATLNNWIPPGTRAPRNRKRGTPSHVLAAIRPLRAWSALGCPSPAWLVATATTATVAYDRGQLGDLVADAPAALVIDLTPLVEVPGGAA